MGGVGLQWETRLNYRGTFLLFKGLSFVAMVVLFKACRKDYYKSDF